MVYEFGSVVDWVALLLSQEMKLFKDELRIVFKGGSYLHSEIAIVYKYSDVTQLRITALESRLVVIKCNSYCVSPFDLKSFRGRNKRKNIYCVLAL